MCKCTSKCRCAGVFDVNEGETSKLASKKRPNISIQKNKAVFHEFRQMDEFIYTPTAFYGTFHCLRSDFEWLLSINRWVVLFFKTSLTFYVLRKPHFYHQRPYFDFQHIYEDYWCLQGLQEVILYVKCCSCFCGVKECVYW